MPPNLDLFATTGSSPPRTARTARPRRGRAVTLGNGIRHDHTVTCTLAGTPDGCDCPYTFWKPGATPRKRVRVVGTLAEVVDYREQLRREASGTIYLDHHQPSTTPAATQSHPPALRAIEAPHAPARTLDLGEWAEQVQQTIWLRHSPRTRQSRGSVYRNHIQPHLSHLDLHDVTTARIETWLADLTTTGVSLHMQRQAYDTLRTMLGHWHDQAGTTNPATLVKRPKAPAASEQRAKDKTLTAKQYQQVIGACTTTAEELLIRCATEAGLRIGELAGLQRRDINLDARTITVKRQGNRNTTKSGERRVIMILTDDLHAALTKHLADMDADGWVAPDSYIWRGGHHYEQQVNKPYERQGIYRIIRRILKRVGLENTTRPHGLRATGAQLLIEAGASLELVSQHLGHAHIRTTEEYYVGTVKTSGLAQFGEAFG